MKACKPSGSLAVTTTMRLKQILLNLTSGNEATESSRLAPVTFQPQCWSALSPSRHMSRSVSYRLLSSIASPRKRENDSRSRT
jgi:hypothetical protein